MTVPIVAMIESNDAPSDRFRRIRVGEDIK